MAAAKAAAIDFVQRQPSSVVIGVVAFSDSGISVQQPSNDQATVIAAINRLTPQKGTSVGQGILASLKAIQAQLAGPTVNYYSNKSPAPTASPTPVPAGYHAPAAIVLLTDGENNENPDPVTVGPGGRQPGRPDLHRRDRQHGRHEPRPERLPGPYRARRGDAPADRPGHRRHVLLAPTTRRA